MKNKTKKQKSSAFQIKTKKNFTILLFFAVLIFSAGAKCPYQILSFSLNQSENLPPDLALAVKNLSKKTITAFEVLLTLSCTDSNSDSETDTPDTEEEFSVFTSTLLEPSECKNLYIPLELNSSTLFSSADKTALDLENFHIENIYLRQVFFQDKTGWKDLTGSYAEFF